MRKPTDQHDRLLGPAGFGYEGYEPEPDEQAGANLWAVIDDRLRGRWKWMLLLGLGLALIAAPLGYFSTQPVFEAEGIIHIRPGGEIIRQETPETEVMAQYPQFVQTQAAKIASSKVLEAALREPELAGKEWTRLPAAISTLRRGLSIDAPRTAQFITVTYAHPEQREARDRLSAVLAAYMKQAGDDGGSTINVKVDRNKNLRNSLNTRLISHGNQLRRLPSVEQFFTTDLKRILDQKIEFMNDLDDQLRSLRMLRSLHENGGDPDQPLTRPTDAQLATIDPELAIYRTDYNVKRREVDLMRESLTDEHVMLRRAIRELEVVQQRYEDRYQAALEQYERAGALVTDPRAATGGMTLNQINIKEKELLESRAAIEDEVRMLSNDIPRARELEMEMEKLRREIDATDRRITDLEVEATDRSRITLFQEAVGAADPARDRRGPFAAIGVMGGLGLSFMLFFVLGSLDRRAYRLTQISGDHRGALRSLGVLPDLGRSLSDPESAEMAAHCVHQIRNLIEATRPPTERGCVIAVSSPYQGDGKTSITLALGFSYAAAGHRTIVVDGDLVGRGLTRQLRLTGSSGLKEVIREGCVNGEIVALGHDSHDGGHRADTHRDQHRDAAGQTESRSREIRSKSPLHALPVGVDSTIGPQGIRRKDMVRVFEELRGLYDIVIVDTGPVLGSLECIPIAAAADGVVLSVRRGRQRSRLEDCASFLQSVNATCYGVVMNCAARSECHRYVSEASIAPSRQALARTSDDQEGPRDSGGRNVLVSALHTTEARGDA